MRTEISTRVERRAVSRSAYSAAGGDTQPRAEVQRHGDLGSELGALHGGGSRQKLIPAMQHADGRIETEIKRQIAPRGLFDRSEARFRHVAQRDASLRTDGQKTFVIDVRQIQAEAAKIVAQKNRGVHFGIDRVPVTIGECQPESKRGKLVEISDKSPAARQQ